MCSAYPLGAYRRVAMYVGIGRYYVFVFIILDADGLMISEKAFDGSLLCKVINESFH